MHRSKERDVVTQEDVAHYAGVSRAIVSYVLNNGPRKVADETRDRVLAAIQDLGYRPNKHAQRLKMGEDFARNSIGIVIGGKGYNLLERSYYSVVLAGLFDSAHHLNQHFRFFSFFDALKDPVFFNKNIHREEISSLLILLPGLILKDPEHEMLFPQIMERIDNILCLETSIYGLPALVIDLAAAAQMAVEHLIELGHRRIGFLALSDHQRIIGYQRALMIHHIAFEETLVRTLDSARLLPTAYQSAAELIATEPAMTAIFAANDEAAIAALAAIHDRGLKVPDDIAIVSIDNTDISQMIRPALTTVKIPIHNMGEYALQFLLSQHVHTVNPPASLILPIELIVRESSGGPRG